jgi:hypothetical protein
MTRQAEMAELYLHTKTYGDDQWFSVTNFYPAFGRSDEIQNVQTMKASLSCYFGFNENFEAAETASPNSNIST